ncbi:Pyridoxal phosphate (PLP)-dependent transferases superfamily protein, putative isoform 2 [Hibiscus syriacus]|uniref:Pyridoxal phosphate (PLP)-dependent transferases superfamily protein, putative isoform 2 n=1 Tax=Hibiscus syriacus TaxID=106335 RepID=A0A6A3CS79_HIBSY|nr:Pyridoxal phosphate (PLP)-dependent transferases superfamily protein, putative isoform 2 [Hibiscus syriacus]
METKAMVKSVLRSKYVVCLVCSIVLNLLLIINLYVGAQWSLTRGWTSRAAAEAEAVAEIVCSGHGKAYLDGFVGDGNEPVCECNTCYTGPDCSRFISLRGECRRHSTSSALVLSGWNRMSYTYSDTTFFSQQLESLIRKLHAFVGMQSHETDTLFSAQVRPKSLVRLLMHCLFKMPPHSRLHELLLQSYYTLYKYQVEYFNSEKFKFEGDAYKWRNRSDGSADVIEFVTAPNNPDGRLNKAILDGPNVKTIYDRAFTGHILQPIPAPADEDLMVFTLSKLTGHAGSRFGWAVIKDETVFNRMVAHMQIHGCFKRCSIRWERLATTLSSSNRFSLQKIDPQFCSFYTEVREFSPAYAWLKCEREEDKDCYAVLKAANIIGRQGNVFGSEDHYVRLSLVEAKMISIY